MRAVIVSVGSLATCCVRAEPRPRLPRAMDAPFAGAPFAEVSGDEDWLQWPSVPRLAASAPPPSPERASFPVPVQVPFPVRVRLTPPNAPMPPTAFGRILPPRFQQGPIPPQGDALPLPPPGPPLPAPPVSAPVFDTPFSATPFPDRYFYAEPWRSASNLGPMEPSDSFAPYAQAQNTRPLAKPYLQPFLERLPEPYGQYPVSFPLPVQAGGPKSNGPYTPWRMIVAPSPKEHRDEQSPLEGRRHVEPRNADRAGVGAGKDRLMRARVAVKEMKEGKEGREVKGRERSDWNGVPNAEELTESKYWASKGWSEAVMADRRPEYPGTLRDENSQAWVPAVLASEPRGIIDFRELSPAEKRQALKEASTTNKKIDKAKVPLLFGGFARLDDHPEDAPLPRLQRPGKAADPRRAFKDARIA